MSAVDLATRLDGPREVRVMVPYGCHTPRVLFLTSEQRALEQLASSRRGATTGGRWVSWWEGDVAVRVDLAEDGADVTARPAPAGEPPLASAAALAAPVRSRSTCPRRRRTSVTANLSAPVAAEIDRLIALALETSPSGFDLDLLRAGKHTFERSLDRVRAQAAS